MPAQGPYTLPSQGLGYVAGTPYEQALGSPTISSADGTIVLVQAGVNLDLSGKAFLDAFLVTLQAAVASSTDIASLKTAIAAIVAP